MEQLACRYLTEEDKRQIYGWKYEGQYAIYNLPAYEEMLARQMGFLKPGREKTSLPFWREQP